MKMRYKQLFIVAAVAILPGCMERSATGSAREAKLSAGWLPQKKNQLVAAIEKYRSMAREWFYLADSKQAHAIIVPHAGLAFSGLAAASAYNTVSSGVDRVILLSPSHKRSFDGIALPNYKTYNTVLGAVHIDNDAIGNLAGKPFFVDDDIHDEHAIDIQLPFIQTVASGSRLIPMIVGSLTSDEQRMATEKIKNLVTQDTLVIATTDLIHHGQSYGYTPFAQDIAANLRTLETAIVGTILEMDQQKFSKVIQQFNATVCGKNAVNLLMKLADEGTFGPIKAEIASYYASPHMARNNFAPKKSADLCTRLSDEDVSSYVGYAGIVLRKQQDTTEFSGYERAALLDLARSTIRDELIGEKQHPAARIPVMTRLLRGPGGAFVTLEKKNGELRGCIGLTTSHLPLAQTVASMAYSSAFNDTRFPQVTLDELDDLRISISVLSQPYPVESYREIILGKHGIILEKDKRSAVYLPSVPIDQGWNIEQTLENLSKKAGFNKKAWQEGASFRVFEGTSIKE